MAKIIVKHDRNNCIACSACASVAPDFWSMGDDGKANLKGASEADGGWTQLEIQESDKEANQKAADSCPVNVIHIEETE